MTAPREFWIFVKEMFEHDPPTFEALTEKPEYGVPIHVIEYSACLAANVEISQERLRTANAVKERDDLKRLARDKYGPAGLKHVSEIMDECERLKAALEDIRRHSENPFVGDKWRKYVNEVAKENLSR